MDRAPGVERLVVVGAGLAGLRTVQAARAAGFVGHVTMLGAEEHAPYDRPPLSKAVLLQDPPPDPTLPADWAGLEVELRLGERVEEVVDGGVRTSRGVVPGDALVIACGAEPVRLPGDARAIHLRRLEDAFSLRKRLRAEARVVVVGAGWIGAEVATAAARRGCSVTVVEAAAEPLAAALPAAVGALVRPWWEQAGVSLRTGLAVSAVDDDAVHLVSGESVPADVVVVAVGVRPAVGFLTGSRVPVDVGVVVDASLRAAEGVWAVGDVAARWSQRYGVRIRGEHWDDAMHAPEVVAAGLLGGVATYDPVPYIWSEQFGRMLQWCGRVGGAEQLVVRGDVTARSAWSLVWIRDDVVRAVLAVDRPHDAVQGRRLATRGQPVDPALVADGEVALKAAVRT